MNYRHAYHAGNFADCFKHALLLLLLRAMRRKEKPFLALDTHAGRGRYDLSGKAACKTGEWRQGIGRLREAHPSALAEYLACIESLGIESLGIESLGIESLGIESLGLYPGSPVIIRSVLRPQDRLIACELNKEEAAALRREMAVGAMMKNIAVHERDGYAALRAFLPPPEKRALILIDPPFEQPDEFAIAAESLAGAWEKFPQGVYALWYPIKHRAPVRDFFETLRRSAIRDAIACELLLREPVNPARLNGCGLLIVNPPYGFEAEATPVLRALRDTLGDALGDGGATVSIERVIDE